MADAQLVQSLKYWRSRGSSWYDISTRLLTQISAYPNNINLDLQYSFRNMYEEWIMEYVAARGLFQSMVYLHGCGCRWDERTVLKAARYGMFVCMKYAIENGCPWNKEATCKEAEKGKHTNCLNYLHEKMA